MGTFLLNTQGNTSSSGQGSNAIYVLIPHPVHITLQLESSLSLRRMLYGLSMANDGMIQTIPVSKTLKSPLTSIDWDMVRQIPEGARVFVSSMWYKELLPFLLERDVEGIFMDNQQDCIEYPEEYKLLVDAKWNFITRDRLSAMEQSIDYLYSLGRRKIAVIKAYKNEPQHPFRKGMISAYKTCSMTYDEKLYREISLEKLFIEDEIIDLWENTKFDALFVGYADLIKPIYKTLTEKLKLRIPDDVALMSFSDNPAYLDFDVPVTAIEFPNVNMGQEAIKIFNRKKSNPSESIFQATIIERESTRKGAGAYVNHALMPEILENENVVNAN
jgi:hypothetical protein